MDIVCLYCLVVGHHGNDNVRADRGGGRTGGRSSPAVDDQRGIIRRRARVETLPRGRDVSGSGEQVL